jgi:hypothetical protein
VSILVYAISRDDARAPAAGDLNEICAAGLRALTESVDGPLSAGLEELVHYEETVEAVMQEHTILPMRFGSIVEDEQHVRDLLTARAHEFGTALTQLDGAVEFGVQASVVSDPHPAAPPDLVAHGRGGSYMRARLEEQYAQRDLQAWLGDALADRVRRASYRVSPVGGSGTISAAYLIDKSAQEAFVQRLEELAQDSDRHTLSWSGPWPPYTFVEGLKQ